jgi:hypothetical protein
MAKNPFFWESFIVSTPFGWRIENIINKKKIPATGG